MQDPKNRPIVEQYIKTCSSSNISKAGSTHRPRGYGLGPRAFKGPEYFTDNTLVDKSSSKPVSICKRFHARRANSGKNDFYGAPSLGRPCSRRIFRPAARSFVAKKTKVFLAAHSERFVILACTVLVGFLGVTDTRTDRRTDASTIAKTLGALHVVARKITESVLYDGYKLCKFIKIQPFYSLLLVFR